MAMKLFRQSTEERIVANGEVWCPVRGVIDVETCVGCASLIDVHRDDADLIVECRPPRVYPDPVGFGLN
jgi:hypothetical protein